ncbi:hypothetical protein HDU93_001691 [Gonapodya sp. JEL0774]|nr:hypothetical protein HDU93_001691 [Gonapodya sp. JEL0774]
MSEAQVKIKKRKRQAGGELQSLPDELEIAPDVKPKKSKKKHAAEGAEELESELVTPKGSEKEATKMEKKEKKKKDKNKKKKKENTEDTAEKTDGNDKKGLVVMEQNSLVVVNASPADADNEGADDVKPAKKEKRKRRKGDTQSDADANSDSKLESSKDDGATTITDTTANEKKRRKKEKKAKEAKEQEDEGRGDSKDGAEKLAPSQTKGASSKPETEAQSKKSKKNRKLSTETSDPLPDTTATTDPSEIETKPSKKDKREEKKKKEKSKPDGVPMTANTAAAGSKAQETTGGGWTQWGNVTADSLGGDEARRDKFLRLMGAKKSGAVPPASSGGGIAGTSKPFTDATDSKTGRRIENDLVSEFERAQALFRQKRTGRGIAIG